MAVYRVPAHSPRGLVGPVSRALGPVGVFVTGNASANAVTATVTVAGNNAVGQGTANPSSVTATVTVDANNAAGQVAGNATATAVTATVTVAATNPTTKLSANPPSVSAAVTVTATNPTVTRLSNASSVTATVTVAATNSTFTRTANPPSVYAAVTVAANNAVGQVPTTLFYPKTVSGRKWLDQNGDPYLLKCMSSWALAENSASNADITTALTQAASRGFNSVQVALFGITQEPDWHPYTNHAGDPVFTGTPFASSLGSAWLTFDWVMDEATRLGLTVVVSLFYGFGTIGCRADMNTAYTASVTNVYNFGHDVAARYASYPNIVWSLEADAEWFYSTAPWGAQTDKYFEGIKAGEGATPRLIISEPNLGNTAYFQWESSFTHTGGFSHFWLDANSVYQYGNAVVDQVDAVMNETGATTYPVWDSEIPYVSNGFPGSANRQQLRERVYGSFFRGVIGMNYGSEDWWPFGYDSWTSGAYTWDTFMAGAEALDAGRAWTLLDGLVADTTWAPDGGTFLTTGLGSGDTKAASGFSDTQAAVYFPSSRTIVVATTVLTGTGNVRLRWYDPTNGTYTTISASEAQNGSRSVTYAGNNSAGDGDQVLVVDVLAVDASANAVTATVTVAANNPTVTVSSSASSVTATVTVAANNPTVTRLSNASAVTATVTVAGTNPTVTSLSNATAVTAAVTVAANNAVGQGTANASSVFAAVTVVANNATGQTTAAGTANSVAALVTVDATNPTVKVSSASASVTATVAYAATNPTVTRLSNATTVTATVTVTATNPTTKLTANPPSVFAAVSAIANNAVGQVNAAGTANAVAATVLVAGTNPTVTRLSNAGALTAGVTATAANTTTKLTASVVAVYAAVLAEAFNASSVRLGLRASTTSVRIASATVAATLTSSSGTDSITSATATEDIT